MGIRGGEGGASGDPRAARDALDRLREAAESLKQDGSAQKARELDEARRTAQSLVQRQAEVRRRLAMAEAADAGSPAGAGVAATIEALMTQG